MAIANELLILHTKLAEKIGKIMVILIISFRVFLGGKKIVGIGVANVDVKFKFKPEIIVVGLECDIRN